MIDDGTFDGRRGGGFFGDGGTSGVSEITEHRGRQPIATFNNLTAKTACPTEIIAQNCNYNVITFFLKTVPAHAALLFFRPFGL